MYKNSKYKATSAKPITKRILDSWYGKYMTGGTDTYQNSIFRQIYPGKSNNQYVKYHNLIDNHGYYWLCTASSGADVCFVDPRNRYVSDSYGSGASVVRVLVSIPLTSMISGVPIEERNVTMEGMKHLNFDDYNVTETYGTETRQSYKVWELKEW